MSEKDYTTVDLVIEINSSLESSALYERYLEQRLTYKQDMGGPLLTIGHVDERPVCIAPLIHEIGGIRVLYVEATSPMVDWTMIEAWIKSKVKPGVPIVNDPINLLGYIYTARRERDLTDKVPEKVKPNNAQLIEMRSSPIMGARQMRFVKSISPHPDHEWTDVVTTNDVHEAKDFGEHAELIAQLLGRASTYIDDDTNLTGYFAVIAASSIK